MERILLIIKPDGVEKGVIGTCLSRFENAGYTLRYLRVMRLKRATVTQFYAHLQPKLPTELFSAIVDYMTRGNVVIALIEGNSIFAAARRLCGVTSPSLAGKGTIRGDYATHDMVERGKMNKPVENIIHYSDNKAEAKRETELLGIVS